MYIDPTAKLSHAAVAILQTRAVVWALFAILEEQKINMKKKKKEEQRGQLVRTFYKVRVKKMGSMREPMLPRLANLSSFSASGVGVKPENSFRTRYSIFLVTISPGKFIDFPFVETLLGAAWSRDREGNQEKEVASESRIGTKAENDDRAKNGGRC